LFVYSKQRGARKQGSVIQCQVVASGLSSMSGRNWLYSLYDK